MLNSARNFITGLALSLCTLGFAAPAAAAEATAMDTFKARHGKVVELVKKRADAAALQKEEKTLEEAAERLKKFK